MKRREFIAGLGGAAAWPIAARAQQSAVPVIGLLSSRAAAASEAVIIPFQQGLKETGYIEGRNVAVEYRWAENEADRLPALAADFVRRRVAVIVAIGDPVALAAKAATATIPIVFTLASDPVLLGLVGSLNRPGGNLTGYAELRTLLYPKRLQLLRELIPSAALIGFLVGSANSPVTELDTRDVLDAAGTLGQEVLVLNARNDAELETAFATFARRRVVGVVIGSAAFFNQRTAHLAELATRHALPTISPNREYAIAGGLMSYGASFEFVFRQGGIYAGRILNGARPADLPVEQVTKIERIINLKTARALGLTIPPNLLALADEVIE